MRCILIPVSRQIKVFVQCTRGVAYVEFALSISLLLVLFLGSIEVTRYVLIIQKLEKTATAVSDVITQSSTNTSPLTDATMVDLLDAVQDMMAPYGTTATMRVVVTDVMDEVNPSSPITPVPTIVWQFCGGGTLSGAAYESKLGTTADTTATLSNAGISGSFAMTSGEEVVIAEVFYSYNPITTFNTYLQPSTLYRNALFMPRYGSLATYAPNGTIHNASNCP